MQWTQTQAYRFSFENERLNSVFRALKQVFGVGEQMCRGTGKFQRKLEARWLPPSRTTRQCAGESLTQRQYKDTRYQTLENKPRASAQSLASVFEGVGWRGVAGNL